jgi:hypothetical protein
MYSNLITSRKERRVAVVPNLVRNNRSATAKALELGVIGHLRQERDPSAPSTTAYLNMRF